MIDTLAVFGPLGAPEILVIGALLAVIVGGPSLAKRMIRSYGEARKELRELKKDAEGTLDDAKKAVTEATE